MAQEDIPFVWVFPLLLSSRVLFSLWREVPFRQMRKLTEGLELEWRTILVMR